MAAFRIFVFVQLVLIGSSLCSLRRNMRRMEKKMEDITTVFHQEVFNLKLELQSLKSDLMLEQEKTASLVEMLNGTQNGDLADIYDSSNENVATSVSTEDFERLQGDVDVIRLAFSYEKNKLKNIEDQFEQEVQSVNMIAARNQADIRRVRTTLAGLSKITTEVKNVSETNADNILEVRDTLRELADNFSETYASSGDIYMVPTFAVTETTLKPHEQTTEPPAETYPKWIRGYPRLSEVPGGSRAAALMYAGATVKRGKDWDWSNKDNGGHGQIVERAPRVNYDWAVKWEHSSSTYYYYRMGKQGKYDLDLVEEKFDFSKCPKE